MNLVSLLWHLQMTDTELDDKTRRVRQVEDALASDPSLATARTANDDAQQRLGALRGQLHDRELEAKALDAKIKEIEERLYSGRVTNPKELDGMEKDLQMHKRQRGALDDKLLELMEAVEQTQKRADEKANSLKQVESARTRDLEQLSHERGSLAARLTELNVERDQTRAALNADALRTYDHLRKTKAGRAVAPIKRDTCSACGVATPTGLVHRVHEGSEIVFCSGCGRILAA
jgi:predicted  nucleic acid-binding Zn-ribbon protein